jgi:hypothetical protein
VVFVNNVLKSWQYQKACYFFNATLEGSVSKEGSVRNVNIVLGVFTDFHMKDFLYSH